MANQLLYKHPIEELVDYELDFSDVLPDDTALSTATGEARDSSGDLVSSGEVTAATVDDPATGYATDDVVEILGGLKPAIIQIDTVGGSGEVLTFTVIDPGEAFIVGVYSTSALTGGGAGLLISIDTVDNSDVLRNVSVNGMNVTMDIFGGVNGQEYRIILTATGNDTGAVRTKVIELRSRENIEGAF